MPIARRKRDARDKLQETYSVSKGFGMSNDDKAEMARKKWPHLIEHFAYDSTLAKTRGVLSEDVSALGEMLGQWEQYQNFCEANGSLADLGVLPKHALEIITADFGTSIVPHIASVQPIKERQGIIYYKTVKSLTTRGNVTSGDTIIDPFHPPNHNGTANYPSGMAGEIVSASLGNTPTTEVSVTGTLTVAPIRPRSVSIEIPALSIRVIDDGNGFLLGNGAWGTIVYSGLVGAGNWELFFAEVPASAYPMTCTYGTDFEESGAVPEIQFELATTDISAEIFALTQSQGMFKSFEFQQRFGQSAEEMMARDLTGALNMELGTQAVSRLIATSVGLVDFDYSTPNFVSYQQHMQELKAKIVQADSTILLNAGRGFVNYIIAGPGACGVIATLDGFEQMQVNTPGCQIWGTLDGKTVIRAPHIASNYLYCVYKGKGGFDTPLVWSPYMPLVVTKTLQDIDNILKQRSVAAVWGGLKVVAPTFVTAIRILSMP